MFDVNSFLQAAASDAFTKRPPLPVGDYIAVIGEFNDKSFKIYPKKDGSGDVKVLNIRLDIDISSNAEAVAVMKGETKVVVFDGVMLELTPGGALDSSPGKNRRLRDYRDALGQNIPGQSWGPIQMTGQVVKVKIDHRDYNGEPQEEVKAVTAV